MRTKSVRKKSGAHSSQNGVAKSNGSPGIADAANGIGAFFARVGNFGRVNTDELCVDDVCVARDEFLRMKEGKRGSPAPQL